MVSIQCVRVRNPAQGKFSYNNLLGICSRLIWLHIEDCFFAWGKWLLTILWSIHT